MSSSTTACLFRYFGSVADPDSSGFEIMSRLQIGIRPLVFIRKLKKVIQIGAERLCFCKFLNCLFKFD